MLVVSRRPNGRADFRPENQYKIPITTTAKTIPISKTVKLFVEIHFDIERGKWMTSLTLEKIVFVFSSGKLLLPIIIKLIEYNPIWVRIPAKMAGILQIVFRKPVTAPEAAPASSAANKERTDRPR